MADLSREEIERLVRRVLAGLLNPGPAAPASPPVPAKPATATETTNRVNQGTLQLDERVISLRLLEGRLAGIQQLVVPRGAVITPAVRDELKRRGIAVQSAASGGKGKTAARLIVAATGPIDAAAMAAAIGESVAVEVVSSASDLGAAIGKWSDAVLGRKVLGVLLTDQPAAAICLANRNHGIRAVLGTAAREISDAVGAIGANGLVIDPRGKGKFEIATIMKTFAASGWRNPPEALRRTLSGT